MHEWYKFDAVYMGNPDQTRHLKCSSLEMRTVAGDVERNKAPTRTKGSDERST